MARSRYHRSLGYRAEQTGCSSRQETRRYIPAHADAADNNRSGLDHGIVIRGQSRAGEPHPRVAPVHSAVPHRRCRPRAAGEHRWSRASLAVDAGAIAAGIGVQRVFAAARTSGCPVPALAPAASSSRSRARRADHRRHARGARSSGPSRRRRSSSSFRPQPRSPSPASCSGGGGERGRAPVDESELSVVKSLAMSLAVAGVTATISAGERKLADRIARAASRVLPGNESLWRPLGHVASLAAIACRHALRDATRLRDDRVT